MKHRRLGEGFRAGLWTSLGCLLIALLMWALLPIVVHARPADDKILSEPTVKVQIGMGHGSGVFIGDGYVVTAAHVVDRAKETIWVISAVNKKRSATVIFLDTVHDIALLKLSMTGDMEAAKLACRVAKIGEEIMVRGNPSLMEFVSTWGRVSGATREIERMWRSVYPVNVMIVGGNSGGPMFDSSGAVLGIVVGMGLFNGSPYIGLVVPSTVVCDALAYLHLKVAA